MVVPVVVRSLAAVAGGALVVAAWASVIGTLIVPRRRGGWLTRYADWIVNRACWAFIVAGNAASRPIATLAKRAVLTRIVSSSLGAGLTACRQV